MVESTTAQATMMTLKLKSVHRLAGTAFHFVLIQSITSCVLSTRAEVRRAEVFWSLHTCLDLEESFENRGKLALSSLKLKLTLVQTTLKLKSVHRLAGTIPHFVFIQCVNSYVFSIPRAEVRRAVRFSGACILVLTSRKALIIEESLRSFIFSENQR